MATAVVAMENVAVFEPDVTVTDAGTVALAFEEVIVTTIPEAGAAEDNVTVPVEEAPPATEAGESVTLLTVGAVIARDAVAELEPSVAVSVALVAAETAVVVTVKVAVVAPAATVTDAGTVALVLLELRLTTEPPVGAAADSVTVPVLDAPPATDVGLRAILLTVTGTVIARDAVFELLL